MTLLQLLIAITIAGICGAIAEFLVGYSPGSVFLVILAGVVGAYLGNGIALLLANTIAGFPPLLLVRVGTITFDIVWAIIGAIILLEILAMLRGGRRRRLFFRDAQN